MRKFLTLLTVSILLLASLTSCNLDKDMKCSFMFQTVISIQDQEAYKAAEEYMETTYIKKTNLPTYFGRHYDAMNQFIDYFQNTNR